MMLKLALSWLVLSFALVAADVNGNITSSESSSISELNLTRWWRNRWWCNRWWCATRFSNLRGLPQTPSEHSAVIDGNTSENVFNKDASINTTLMESSSISELNLTRWWCNRWWCATRSANLRGSPQAPLDHSAVIDVNASSIAFNHDASIGNTTSAESVAMFELNLARWWCNRWWCATRSTNSRGSPQAPPEHSAVIDGNAPEIVFNQDKSIGNTRSVENSSISELNLTRCRYSRFWCR